MTEAARWTLTFAADHLPLLAAVAGVLAVALTLLVRPEVRHLSPAVRWTLLLCRATAVLLLAVLLAEPVLRGESSQEQPPVVTVLVDRSASMAVVDDPTGDGGDRATRAAAFVADHLKPALDGRAEVRVLSLTAKPTALDDASPPPAGDTDLAAPLAAVAKAAAAENLGAVVVLSDGRQTAGGDPLPAVNALAARGVRVAAVQVGGSQPPPDAAVLDVLGNREVFADETIRLDVSFRIVGYPERPWDLLLKREGEIVQRRRVVGAGAVQRERFELPAGAVGTAVLRAELVGLGADSPRSLLRPAGFVTREVWTGVRSERLDDAAAVLRRPPTREEPLTELRVPAGDEPDFLCRIRGWLFPPVAGEYRFLIASDDGARFRLTDVDPPAEAKVESYTDRPDQWDKEPGQRSAPVTLTAGRPVAFEILHKQGGGGHHLAVGWQRPDGVDQRPIPGEFLAPLDRPASTDPTGDEADVPEATLANNAAELVVAVNRDPIRVLLLDAWPRWESRYLQSLFERDPRVELTRRYRSVRVPRGEAQFVPDSQEELDAFDAVVVGDLTADELPPPDQQRLARFVAERAGFVVFLAGRRGLPGGYSLGPLADLLPVRPSAALPEPGGPVRVRLTADGVGDPVVAVLEDAELNEQLWPLLPPLQTVADGVVAKPATTVLLETADAAATPIVGLSQFGAGRVLWLGTAESWRWRDRLGDRIHQTFWTQALRWGLGVRLRGGDPALQVSLDSNALLPGESAQLRARATTAAGVVASPLPVTLQRLDSGDRVAETLKLELAPLTGTAGIQGRSLADLPAGRWRVTVTTPDGTLSESRPLLVRAENPRETLDWTADADALARIAAAGGAEPTTLADAPAALDGWFADLKPATTTRRQTFRLWDNYAALLALLAVLLTEWLLRKRHSLA